MAARGGSPRGFRWPRRDREQLAREVDEEIAFHLEMRAAELEAAGLSPEAARERASREFGDVAALRRALLRADGRVERRRRWWAWLADARQDARFAVRSFRRSPGFAAAAVATLALGIGASVAVFAVVNAVVLRPLPYPEPDELVRISPGQVFNITLADAVVAEAPSIVASTGLSLWGLTLTGRGDATRLRAQFVDAGFFEVFGVRPLLGRAFGPEHRDPARSGVVVLSHALWQARFGGDPGIVGEVIELDGGGHERREVIGVMPPGFEAPLVPEGVRVDVWAPLSLAPGRTFATDSTWYVGAVVGRLAPGATVERAAREVRAGMERIRDRVRAEYGPLIGEDRVRTAGASGLLDSMVGDVRGPLWMLLAAVGLVLLLACANLANLLLARGDGRRRELALRTALGARRGRLLRELLTESVLLSLGGGAAGVALAWVMLGVLEVGAASGLPRAGGLEIDGVVLAFALAASLASVLAFGLLPALRASGGDLRGELGSGGRAAGGTRAGRRLGATLIAGEVALAMVLVTAAALLLNSLRALRAVDPGLDAADVLVLSLAPPPAAYAGDRASLYYDAVRARLAALPGVRGVGAIQVLPFTNADWAFPYLAEGHAPPADGPLPSASFRVVTPGYFDAVDVPLLAGRHLDAGDRAGGEAVGVINRTLAERLWPGGEAVGRTIRLFGSDPFRVVGVVGDVRQFGPGAPSEPAIYLPLAQWPVASMVVMVETAGDPESLAAAARAAVRSIDPNVPVASIRSLDDVLGGSIREQRFFAGVLTFFGALALGLGAVGVYGVMAYTIGARLREFGVRIALGATPRQVVRGALASGLAPVAVGLAAGAGGALAATRLLEGLLFGVGARDPATFAVAAAVLAGVAAAATWLPAYRAGRVDPAGVLKGE
ncbi:MAG TPA: ADOP family duplicated permease [Longimicrobiales bacterium]